MLDVSTHSQRDATRGFLAPARPPDERARLAALQRLKILDSPREERFDRIVRLAARLFNVPIAYVSMVDEHRQWFKAQVGLHVQETKREISFCGHAILQDDILLVPDATLDPRFAENPQVVGEPYVRFYAGRPLRGPEEQKVGTLCLMDTKPRTLTPEERALLHELAALVERELSLTETIGWQEETLRVKEELLESERMVAGLYRELAGEKEKSHELLLNILPASVADELKERGSVEAVHYPCTSVMFTDFVGFTQHTEQLPPALLVAELNDCFSEFDRIVERHSVEKLKTIGDGYMAVAGIKGQCQHHARNLVRAALEIRNFVVARRAAKLPANHGTAWEIRIGIHTGPVVAGVVGLNKFAYDVWGDTVNLAARLEKLSLPGRVTVSGRTQEMLGPAFRCTARGTVEVRHHTNVEAFFVEEELSLEMPAVPAS